MRPSLGNRGRPALSSPDSIPLCPCGSRPIHVSNPRLRSTRRLSRPLRRSRRSAASAIPAADSNAYWLDGAGPPLGRFRQDARKKVALPSPNSHALSSAVPLKSDGESLPEQGAVAFLVATHIRKRNLYFESQKFREEPWKQDTPREVQVNLQLAVANSNPGTSMSNERKTCPSRDPGLLKIWPWSFGQKDRPPLPQPVSHVRGDNSKRQKRRNPARETVNEKGLRRCHESKSV